MDIVKQLQADHHELDVVLSSKKDIYIYGTGVVASIAYEYIVSHDKDVKGFIVTNEVPEGTRFRRKNVTGLHSAREGINSDCYIIIAVSQKYKDEIRGILVDECGEEYLQEHIVLFGEYEQEDSVQYYAGVKGTGSFFSSYKRLDSIGKETGTDKCSAYHDYLCKYEFFFKDLMDKELVLMELGVFHGESIKMWSDYFENATIIGVDIDNECEQYVSGRIQIIISDLSDRESYEKLRSIKADIIIDDALHSYSQQIRAFSELFFSMPHGGVYIVEDIGTSFGSFRKTVSNDLCVTGYEFFEGLCELSTGGELELHSKLKLVEDEMRELANMVDMITFIYGSCIIVKR